MKLMFLSFIFLTLPLPVDSKDLKKNTTTNLKGFTEVDRKYVTPECDKNAEIIAGFEFTLSNCRKWTDSEGELHTIGDLSITNKYDEPRQLHLLATINPFYAKSKLSLFPRSPNQNDRDGIVREMRVSIIFPPRKTLELVVPVNLEKNVYGDESYTGISYWVVSAEKDDSKTPDEVISLSCNSGVKTGIDVTITPTCDKKGDKNFTIQNTKEEYRAFTRIVANLKINDFIIRKSITLAGGKQTPIGVFNNSSATNSYNETYSFEIYRAADDPDTLF